MKANWRNMKENILAEATAITLLFQVATSLKVCFICQNDAGC